MLLKESLDSQRLFFRKLLSLGKPVGYSLRSGSPWPLRHADQIPDRTRLFPIVRSDESTRFLRSFMRSITGPFCASHWRPNRLELY